MYQLYHHSTHHLFESFHVKFIERKDDIPRPLYPGHVIDLPPSDSIPPVPSTPSSSSAPPVPQSVSSMPKHTSIPVEEEPIHDDHTVPDNDIEVPVILHDNPADVVPVGDINVSHRSA